MAQAYLHGDSLQDACVAIIVPDEEELALWARKNNVAGDYTELCQKEVMIRNASVGLQWMEENVS